MCDQSRPTSGMMCPSTSLRVMVPSMSDMMILSVGRHRKMDAFTVCSPCSADTTLKLTVLRPLCSFSERSIALVGRSDLTNVGLLGERTARGELVADEGAVGAASGSSVGRGWMAAFEVRLGVCTVMEVAVLASSSCAFVSSVDRFSIDLLCLMLGCCCSSPSGGCAGSAVAAACVTASTVLLASPTVSIGGGFLERNQSRQLRPPLSGELTITLSARLLFGSIATESSSVARPSTGCGSSIVCSRSRADCVMARGRPKASVDRMSGSATRDGYSLDW